ncbi:MAG: ABC transporter ATP-binding protein [Alphaproteobacteria bacterium]|nr:ABC transporter ATP-binding protein [Alphaproteobacteria bacterium]MCD8571452.1 ABC transporter ATP-binding protein [Alphaproteobacteria bacterium]
MQNAIEIRGLKKTYAASAKSPEKTALHGVDIDIPAGSIFGLLGPNGAGKSTIINIMAGLVTKSEGTVKIWGRDIDADPRNARAAIGVVPQEVNIDPFFTPRQSLELMAGLYGVPKAERITEKLLDMVGLLDKADAYARSLSGGMKRRLMVAKAFVHQPPILVLDEPTAGVDIELRKMLWKNVKALNKQGVTILLTTHYLEEAEEMCDRIAIINHGKVVANEETETLLSGIDNKEIRFVIDRKIEAIPDTKGRFTLEKEGGRTLVARYAPGEVKAGDIIALIQKSGYGIADLSTNDADLEDVFLKLTSNAG